MKRLSYNELNNIFGGSFYTPIDLIVKIFRTIKIKLLMSKLFTN